MGVAAVPGSGKTETLSRLAAQLISSHRLASHQEILIVTLVNSAVDNFHRRVSSYVHARGLLPNLGYRVRTLHGLAHDVVRERPSLVGLADDFQIIDERVAESIYNEVVASWLHSHGGELSRYLVENLSEDKQAWVRKQPLPDLVREVAVNFTRYAKDMQLTPSALRERLDSLVMPLALAEMGWALYADYQRALAYRGAVDFDDLIRLALAALDSDADFLARLQARWPFILEDEAQDSSRLQELILRKLVGPNGNWVRVGDPNQAIFETFTTASPQFLRNFLTEEGVTPRELPNSGRSTLSIIALANHLIDWTRREHPVPAVRDALSRPHIEPTPPGDPQPNPPDDPTQIYLLARKYTPEREVQAVAESVVRWLPEHPESTLAILVPRNQRGFEVADALKARGVEVVDSLLRSTLSTRQAASALKAILSWLADPKSSQRLADVYRAWRAATQAEEAEDKAATEKLARLLARISHVEEFVAPRAGVDWLETAPLAEAAREQFVALRMLCQRWQRAILLPIDQLILTLAQDLFDQPGELAIAHKLAVTLRQEADEHPDWRLPDLAEALAQIAANQRRFLGLSEDDTGFDPNQHRGKAVIATFHKAKGLEWDRVYLMSVNAYDFPSAQPYDQYIAEKWFVAGQLNLDAETRAQLDAVIQSDERAFYREGHASEQARLDYVRERLRLLYVGITRARRDLIVTWNSGRDGNVTRALPMVALQAFWEDFTHESAQ